MQCPILHNARGSVILYISTECGFGFDLSFARFEVVVFCLSVALGVMNSALNGESLHPNAFVRNSAEGNHTEGNFC